MLTLVQSAVLGRWRATSEDLFHEVARLVGAAPGREVLVAGADPHGLAPWLARRTRTSVTSVHPDTPGIDNARHVGRQKNAAPAIHHEQCRLDDLAFADDVFDAAVGEPALSAAAEPQRAISELVRVVKPFGLVVLLQPTWMSGTPAGTRELVVERLGLRPFLVVEWKQMLRTAGAVELQVQDWTDGSPGGRALPPLRPARLSWQQKMHIVGRSWHRWGLRGARSMVERESALLRDLSHERAIGFHLLAAHKWPHGGRIEDR
ncbi:MAG: methyltransferase domain-containing protein [Gemmatimonadota bacterium]|nr:methyltransferase domain-containing protein [Gemmatimonadota bacterium]